MNSKKSNITKRGGMGKCLQEVADNSKRYDDTDEEKFPGAYKEGTKVLALMRDSKTWLVSEIYSVRNALFFPEDVGSLIPADEELNLYDEEFVTQHPDNNQDGEKLTYCQKYMAEFKEQQKALELKAKELEVSKEEGKLNTSNPNSGFSQEVPIVEEQPIIEKDKLLQDLPASQVNTTNVPALTQGDKKDTNTQNGKLNIGDDTEIYRSMRYEYYIHYFGIDRRNDRWVTEQFLKIDPDEIHEQEQKINKEEEERNRANLEREKKYLFNDEHHGMSEKDVDEFMKQTKIKTVESIQFGNNWLETWYFTPLPKEFHGKCLYVCDFCLYFCIHKKELIRHSSKCTVRYPPGDEIWRRGNLSFFEVSGAGQRVYCENLSYISRMFLDHKNIYNSIQAFLFYVLCEVKDDGFHFVGYFSKERDRQANQNNLSCIMVMPFCQKTGYGKLLIEMSYGLSMIESKPGGPERPLSDLGHRVYVSYWTRRVVKVLLQLEEDKKDISILEIQNRTGMTEDDIKYILENQEILRCDKNQSTLNCDPIFLHEVLQHSGRPGIEIDIKDIRWKPYITNLDEQ